MQDLESSYQAHFRPEGSENRLAEAGRNAFADTVNELYRPATKYTTDAIPGLKEDCAKSFLPECSIFGELGSKKDPDGLIKKPEFGAKKEELGSKKDEHGLIKKPDFGSKKDELGSKKDELGSIKKTEFDGLSKEQGLKLKGKPDHPHEIKPSEIKPNTSSTGSLEPKPGTRGAITNELPPAAWDRPVKPVKPGVSDHLEHSSEKRVDKPQQPYMGVFKTPEGDLIKKPLDDDQRKKVELTNEMKKKSAY